MIPFEIEPRLLEFAPAGEPTIIIATGDEPRHIRFALRLQQEFRTQVIAWYQLASPAPPPRPPAPPPPPVALPRRIVRRAKRLIARKQAPPAAAPPAPAPSIFAHELPGLRPHAVVTPRIVPRGHIHTAEFVDELRALRPFFFLTLGGGLYSAAVLAAVRGVAINQHAGFSPDYKGNQTTMQALYHRDLSRVAATVHITTTGADAGPILRRSNPCVTPRDMPITISERVVALGTELMIECVHEICDTGRILAFDQPLSGRTYLSSECDADIRGPVDADFARGWLPKAMARRRAW